MAASSLTPFHCPTLKKKKWQKHDCTSLLSVSHRLPWHRDVDCAPDELLLVLIPGQVLQLVDCGAEHEPSHHLVFIGEDVTPLPTPYTSDCEASRPITYFELAKQRSVRKNYGTINAILRATYVGCTGVALYDTCSGIAYRVTLKHEFFFNLFSRYTASVNTAHPQFRNVPISTKLIALHVVIVHIANQKFVRRIIDHFCRSTPDL